MVFTFHWPLSQLFWEVVWFFFEQNVIYDKIVIFFFHLLSHWLNLPNLEWKLFKWEKHVILTQIKLLSTQWTLKRPKNFQRPIFFFKGQIWSPKANIFKFYDFFTDLGYFEVNYSGKIIGLSKKAIKADKRP